MPETKDASTRLEDAFGAARSYLQSYPADKRNDLPGQR